MYTEYQLKAVEDGTFTKPRVTLADIEASIVSEHYFTAADGVVGDRFNDVRYGGNEIGEGIPAPLELVTFCVLVLRNGFTVTGESFCADSERYDAEVGREVAREKAIEKLWSLKVFEFKEMSLRGDRPS